MTSIESEDPRFGDWPIPQSLLIEIGRIASLWTVLESLINFALGRLSGVDPLEPSQVILFEHLNMPQKLDILGALASADENSKIDPQELSEALRMVRRAQSERNRYLHNSVILDEENGQYFIMQMSARGRVKITTDPVSVESLRATVCLIGEATQALSKAIYGDEVLPPLK
jgi:hypothetical protein